MGVGQLTEDRIKEIFDAHRHRVEDCDSGIDDDNLLEFVSAILAAQADGIGIAEAKPHNTASIASGLFCKACGWPVVHACCNDEMSVKPWGADYWGYCSNKGCKNHQGEEWGQDDPEFAFRSDQS